MERLYVVVRQDLSPGQILAQSNHATSQFARLYRELHDSWSDHEKNLIVLAIPSERELGALVRKAAELGIPRAEFYEPDLRHELTACAFAGEIAKHVSELPLALREPRCPTCKEAPLVPICARCAA